MLFEQVARRVHPAFSLDAALEPVTRICRSVEGLPLGIELSAAWTHRCPPAEISRQIEANTDFLATSMPDVPARHRSIRVVFAHSWQLLTREEQAVFRKLTVFQGGFSLESARYVAGASPAEIGALAEKSLLHRSGEARFDMHNLLRQFANEKSAHEPDDDRAARTAHSNFFAGYLREREAALYGSDPVTAQRAISLEIENIRAAWNWACETRALGSIRQAARALGRFYDMRSWFTEGKDAFLQAVNALNALTPQNEEILPMLAQITAQLAWFEVQTGAYRSAVERLERILPALENAQNLPGVGIHTERATVLNVLGSALYELGELDKAAICFEESLQDAARISGRAEMAFANNYLGNIARNQGNFSQAEAFFTASLAQYRQINDRWGIARVLNNLGNMAGVAGEYDKAEQFFRESLVLRRNLGDKAGVAGCLHNLSIIAFLENDYAKTRELREESLSICREIGFTWGIASTLKHLGDVDKAQGDLAQAQTRYIESLTISEQSGDRRSMAFTLNGLGGLSLMRDAPAQAREYYSRALQIAMEVEVIPLVVDILLGIVELHIRDENWGEAYRLLSFARNHPGGERQTRDRGAQLEARFANRLPAEERKNLISQASRWTLESCVAEISRNLCQIDDRGMGVLTIRHA
jgi:tetratricopeptide (TPR) repeat protein